MRFASAVVSPDPDRRVGQHGHPEPTNDLARQIIERVEATLGKEHTVGLLIDRIAGEHDN
jgi:hypothetical protein